MFLKVPTRMPPFRYAPILAVSLMILSCDSPWPLDRADDPRRCDPACTGGKVCRSGECVVGDASVGSDLSTDGSRQDRGNKDGPVKKDQAVPDKMTVTPDQSQKKVGYGSKCNNGFPACQPGLDCMAVGSATASFCTKTCSTTGGVCSGTPAGTVAHCLLGNSSKVKHCVFLCKLNSQTWPCPGNLTCSSNPNPPGSTQYPCMP